MSTNLIKALGVALGVSILGGVLIAKSPVATLKKGDKAPAFSATGTDGKTHTVASITKSGPAFLYFIKEGCPVNHKAAPHVTAMFEKYAKKGNLIGVYNGSVESAKKWAGRYGAKYTILADPNMSIIKGYGIPYSPFMMEVGKDGKVSSVMEGLSPKELTMFNTSYSKAVGLDTIAMDFKGAPSGGG